MINWQLSNRQSHAINWLKWVAIATMCIDHLRFGLEQVETPLYFIGRCAYPLFAVLIGWNAKFYSKSIFKYAFRIFLLGIILELVHYYAAYYLGIYKPSKLNPILTLASGVALIGIIKYDKDLIPACILCLIPIHIYFSYGLFGALLPLLVYVSLSNIVWMPFLLINTFYLNDTWDYGIVGSLTIVLAFSALYFGLNKCPLPNNKWLYMAFPLSFIPPIILAVLNKT